MERLGHDLTLFIFVGQAAYGRLSRVILYVINTWASAPRALSRPPINKGNLYQALFAMVLGAAVMVLLRH